MQFRRPAILLVALGFAGCQQAEIACGCATYAMEISAQDQVGKALVLDSLRFLWGTDTFRLIPDSNQISLSLGYREGLYRVIAFHGGQASDTASLDVRIGGPKECRTLSTHSVQFTFTDTGKPTFIARELGGCGQHTN